MRGPAGDEDGEGFVVRAFEDLEFRAGTKLKVFEKFEEAFIFFIDAQNFGGFVGMKIGEEYAAFLA